MNDDGYVRAGSKMTYDEFIESLYDLDRSELRRLAYEALLISDGPDKIEGNVDDCDVTVLYYNGSDSFRIYKG